MVTQHRYAEVNGRQIYYREAGPVDGPAIVLLHGTPASSHMYRNLIPALADRYHVIAPDYPGFDRSEANAAALRGLISVDGIKWQYTHGVSDPSVVDPDAWVNAHAAVAGSEEAIAIQLALFADYTANVELYPRVHEYFRSSHVPLLAVWP